MDFFTYYKDITSNTNFFQIFQLMHIGMLCLLFISIYILLKRYQSLNEAGKRRFQIHMAIYFFVEEMIYAVWLLLRCHDNVWKELIPLQLCSLCVYVAIAAVYFKKSELRFFSGIVGTLAGLIAVIYPANLSGLYPAFSYRTINFFILHGAFILFGLIQLQDKELLKYGNIKRCTYLLSAMVITAFAVNMALHTDYMFLGIPSSIAFIGEVYKMTGIFLFIPVVISILTMIQWFSVFVFKRVMDRK